MVNGKWLMGRGGTGAANGRAAPKAFGVKSPTLQEETTAAGPVALQAEAPLREGSPRTNIKITKRSQFFGELYDVDWLDGQCVRIQSVPI